MSKKYIQPGDKVKIKVLAENREWGYDPAPDGTVVILKEFGEIAYGRTNGHTPPGIYVNRCWADVELPDGKVEHISTMHLEPMNKDEDFGRFMPHSPDADKISDLPHTKFWEDDIVEMDWGNAGRPERGYICRVNYERMNHKRNNGNPWPFYDVQRIPAGGQSAYEETELKLISRGNVWKYYHDEPLTFADLKEEANFAKKLGKTDGVLNPTSGDYSWTKDEVLAAIKAGAVHGLLVEGGMFGSGPITRAMRFHDEDLGRRIAAATLAGFGL